MPKIHVLDKHTAELIAAGEVVERPASVVKELLENTIDAGATTVTLEIKNGGISLIRITDNGCGIAHEDVPRAFLRHATSKVRYEQDLEEIRTLGFRGEALASVAAVADVQLTTCTDESGLGTRYHICGGEERDYAECGTAKGTVIAVADLFYNVPARMKFLKKDVSEGNAVAGVVQKLALSHPEISFRFIREGREEFLTPGNGDLYATIYAVLGRDFAGGLIPVSYALDGVQVEGFCCKPSATRANRTMQYFFINGRYVKTDTAAVALGRAYQGLIMTGRYPACVLHITLPPQAVDVNVHPAKIEVRFVNEKPVFDAVYHGVRSALQSGDTLQKVSVPQTAKRQNPFEKRDVQPKNSGMQTSFDNLMRRTTSITPQPQPLEKVAVTPLARPTMPQISHGVPASPRKVMRDTTSPDIAVDSIEELMPVKAAPIEKTVAPAVETIPTESLSVQEDTVPLVRVVGEIFATYILAECGEDMVVVDKHAAHERILYNKLKDSAAPDAQLLLEPVTVTLDSDAMNALFASASTLEAAGYSIEDFGGLTVLVRAIPTVLAGCDVKALIEEIAGGLASGKRDVLTAKEDWIYHSIACRAAIKAGDTTKPQEWQALVERVLTDKQVRYCPHGRPVCFVMTKKELEKQFGRIV